MIFKGRVINVGTLQSGVGKEGNEWASIEVVVEDEAQYPNSAVFKLFKNKENVKYVKSFTSDYPIGTLVEVDFNLKSKEYNGKFYNELSIWKIMKLAETGTVVQQGSSATIDPVYTLVAEDEEPLPF
jgi:hypothetical protein